MGDDIADDEGDGIADDPEKLAWFLKKKASENEISYDLHKMVLRVKAVGPIAWGVLMAAIVVAVIALLSAAPSGLATGGYSALVTVPSAGGSLATAAAIIGTAAAGFLVRLGVAARDPKAVSTLYHEYDVKDRDGRYFLVRKPG